MSDRKYKHAKNEQEFNYQRTIREQQCLIKLLVHGLSTAGNSAIGVRVTKAAFQSVDTFAPLTIYQDKISGDILFYIGKPDDLPPAIRGGA